MAQPPHQSELARFLAARERLIAHRSDYHAAIADFHWPELQHFNWATDYFDAVAADNHAPALRIVEESGARTQLSYQQLSQRSSQVAHFLKRLGIGVGDRLLLMLGNEAPLWETMLAAIKLGAVVIPATPLLSGADLADRIQRGKVRLVLTNVTGMAKIDALPAAMRLDLKCVSVADAPRDRWIPYARSQQEASSFSDAPLLGVEQPMLEYFTSGTTSQPKLVQHTRQSYACGHLSTLYWLGLKPADVHWTISSPGWAKHGWGCFFAPLNAQACVFAYNYTRFDGPAILAALVREQVQTLCAPPTVWRMLILEDLKRWPVQLRELISAGEPLNPEVIAQVRAAWGLEVREAYGQTETTAMIGNPPGAPLTPGSMGRPLPGYAIALLDADGQPAGEGEICIELARRPVGLMTGYADDAALTARVMRDGYYHTGDIGSRDADGYITYVGRDDDVFKASGYRISPFELESALLEHPAVAEAAVVPSPDPVRGFVPKAYVVAAPGHAADAATAAAIFHFMRARVSPYKMIRRIEFAPLPKNIAGKIRRVELRRQEQGRTAGQARSPDEYLEGSG